MGATSSIQRFSDYNGYLQILDNMSDKKKNKETEGMYAQKQQPVDNNDSDSDDPIFGKKKKKQQNQKNNKNPRQKKKKDESEEETKVEPEIVPEETK